MYSGGELSKGRERDTQRGQSGQGAAAGQHRQSGWHKPASALRHHAASAWPKVPLQRPTETQQLTKKWSRGVSAWGLPHSPRSLPVCLGHSSRELFWLCGCHPWFCQSCPPSPRTVGSASSPGRSLLASSCAFFFSPFLPMLRMRLTVPPRPQGPRGGSSSVEVSAGSQVAACWDSASWGVLLLGSPQLCSTPDGASERGDVGGEMAVFSGSFGSNLCTGSRREEGMNFTGLWMLSRWGGTCEACCSWGARQEREHEGRAVGARRFLRIAFPLPCLNPRDSHRYWHASLPTFCTTHSIQCLCYSQLQGWSFSLTVSAWLGTHLTSGGCA